MPILRKSGDFMSFLSGLFRSRDKPKNSTSGSSYRFFYGQSSAGKCVTERSAMQMTAVYACVRILSEAVAGLPLHLYKYNSKYTSASTLAAVGGTYTFTYNAITNLLVVGYSK